MFAPTPRLPIDFSDLDAHGLPQPAGTVPLFAIPPLPMHRIRPRRVRARSLSPTFTFERPPTSVPDDEVFSEEGRPRFAPVSTDSTSRVGRAQSLRHAEIIGPRRVPLKERTGRKRSGEESDDINMEDYIRRLRQQKYPGSDGIFVPGMGKKDSTTPKPVNLTNVVSLPLTL